MAIVRTPFLIFVFLIVSSGAVKAEVEADLFDLSLRQLMNMPVLGSTLTEETVSSVPSAVTVFDEQFIQSLGIDYLYELLNFVPGYQSHRTPDAPVAYGYSVRGRRNGGQSKEVLLVVDGQVVNDPRTGSANGAIRLMSVKQIERIEIIRGPGSALYGSGAYSGVINIITRRNYQILNARVGQFGEMGVSGNATGELLGWTVNTNLNAERDDGDEFILDNHFTVADQTDQIRTRDGFDLIELNVNAVKEDTEVGAIFHSLESTGFYSIETVSPGFNYNHSQLAMLYWHQNIDWTDAIDTTWSISYSHVDQHLHSQITGEGVFSDNSAPPYSDPLSDDPLFLKAFIEEEGIRAKLHNDWNVGDDLSVQFGIDWSRSEELVSKAANNYDALALGLNQFPIAYYGNFENDSVAQKQDPLDVVGVYGQTLINLSELNQLNLGLRFDATEKQSSHFSPRLGWVYHLNDNETFKVLYGEAFRAAALNETANPDSPIQQGDPDLNHEFIRTLDLVYLYQQDNLNFQLGAFFNEYHDPITVEVVSNIRRFVNGDESESSGAELEINYNLGSYSWIRFSHLHIFNLPDAFFRESDRQSSLVYNTHFGDWWFNLSMVHGGEKAYLSGNDVISIPSYYVFNTKLQYQISSNNMLSFQIKNLFDDSYYGAPQGNRLNKAIPARGIQATFEVTYQFD